MEVEYEWNTFRNVRGVRKYSKSKNKGKFVTCAVGDTVDELNKNNYLIACILSRLKTSKGVETKVTGWKWREEMGVSNDVH